MVAHVHGSVAQHGQSSRLLRSPSPAVCACHSGNRRREIPKAAAPRPTVSLVAHVHGSVAQHGRAPGSYPGTCRFDACRGHSHQNSGRTATARYPVSKTGGSSGLGGSTPSPSSLEAWPSWEGSALLPRRRSPPFAGSSPAASAFRPVAQRRRAVGFGPTRARSNRAGASRHTMRRRSTVGRPAVSRKMLVRPQPSQPRSTHTSPGLEPGRGCRSLTSATRVRLPLGAPTLSDASGDATRSSAGRGGFDSRRERFLAVAQRMSAALLPRAMGVRLLPARLRRKASSEPPGREPDEQGATPWRRPTLCARSEPASRGFRSREDP